MRALIVDDDVAMSRVFARALTLWGWNIDECHSITEALTLFRNGSYDLAVCDVDLPDGNGIFLASALLKVRPTLRVVIASGNPRNLEKARAAGLNACLDKPFGLEQLQTMVEYDAPPQRAQ